MSCASERLHIPCGNTEGVSEIDLLVGDRRGSIPRVSPVISDWFRNKGGFSLEWVVSPQPDSQLGGLPP